MNKQELLQELIKYLQNEGWEVILISEEGILEGDVGKKNSFRLSFKFIGKKRPTALPSTKNKSKVRGKHGKR